MIEAGSVGVSFTVRDDASAALERLAREFNELQVSIDKIKESMSSIGAAEDGPIAKLREQFAQIGRAGEDASSIIMGAFGKVDGAVDGTIGRVNALKESLASAAREAEAFKIAPGIGGFGGGSGPHPGGAGGIGMHEKFGPVGVRSHEAETVGYAVAGFGAWEALKANADLQQVQQNLLAGGVSQDMVEKATGSAFNIGQQYGLTARDVLQSINEIRNPLNRGTTANDGVEAALAHMPALAAAANVLKAQGGDKGEDTAKELYELVKSAEFRNAIGDKDFDHAINSMVKSDVATGGIVNPKTFLQMSQMLKGALPGLSDDYLYQVMPELAQEFKGPQAGTAAASLYQQIVAGQMRTTGLKLLDGIELIDESKAEFDHNGRIVRTKPGAYKDEETFKSNPMLGMSNLIDALKEHGITAEGDQRDYLTQVFGNRNAAQMAMTLGYQYPRLERGAQGVRNTLDTDKNSANLLANNPYTGWQQFTSAATNAAAAIGGQLMPDATNALKDLTAATQGFGALLSGKGGAADINKAVFGNHDAPDWMKWIEGNWSHDQRLFGGGSGPHPASGPDHSAMDAVLGRDPHSPQVGPLAYSFSSIHTPIAAPPAVSLQPGGTVTGVAPINVTVQANVTAAIQTVMAQVKAEISGTLTELMSGFRTGAGNSSAGFDGRAAPSTPDASTMHGAH